MCVRGHSKIRNVRSDGQTSFRVANLTWFVSSQSGARVAADLLVGVAVASSSSVAPRFFLVSSTTACKHCRMFIDQNFWCCWSIRRQCGGQKQKKCGRTFVDAQFWQSRRCITQCSPSSCPDVLPGMVDGIADVNVAVAVD